ncbi:MAG: type IV pilus secretin PilQ [Gammaproteobacteria bacterium]
MRTQLDLLQHRAIRLLGALLLFCGAAHAQGDRALQSVDFVALPNDRVLVTLNLSEAAPEPLSFTVEKPARLTVDLPGTRMAVAERFRRIDLGVARSLAVAEARGRTRLVFELAQLSPYNLRVDGKRIYLELNSEAAGAPPPLPAPLASGAPAPVPPPKVAVTNIDFRRGEKGEGRIVVTLADQRTAVDVREEGGRVIARFRNTAIAAPLLRRLDVLDFATPVKYVDARKAGMDGEIVITPIEKADFEHVAYQTGNQFTLELQPLTAEKIEQRRLSRPQYTGERISLSFQSVDVRALLQIIADVAGTNMVVSDGVRGNVAMRLQNVPWDQALDIILRTKGLGMRQQGNVMLVAPLEEIAAREKIELESQIQKIDLSPLRSELIQINYARADEIARLVKSGSSSILSERGQVNVDERTNTLIVLDTREKITEVRDLIARLDIPVRQVLIESRIVIARDDYRKEIGSRFGVTAVAEPGSNGLVTTSGTQTATQDLVSSQPLAIGAINPSTNSIDRYNVNLPTPGGRSGGIGLAILGADFLIDLELSALQEEGRGEIISTPRVITANGKKAFVEQGREIPYLEASSSGATSISFKKAVLSLTVTPQITPDNRILMDLDVTNDAQGQNVALGLGTAPAIDTRRLSTQVLVKTGDTVVLGGVFEQTTSDDRSKVPLLGDIPLIGRLFSNDRRNNSKRELLIFVTPKTLQEGLTVE